MSYYNQNSYGNANSYNNNYHQQSPAAHHQEADFDDYYTQGNASTQWDNRSAKSSHTVHSNYSTQPINNKGVFEQQPPMPAPYQPSPVVDYPPTHRVQFPGNFGGPQRTYTQESAGFSSAREKLMKRRVRSPACAPPIISSKPFPTFVLICL